MNLIIFGGIGFANANSLGVVSSYFGKEISSLVSSASEVCPEKAFLDHFGKERLMVGAMADDSFFQQNPNLLDVRYIYLADAIFDSETPCSSCASQCRTSWWGCWQDAQRPPGQYLRDFLAKAESARQIPMITYYTFAQTSGTESQVSPANNLSFLRRYFNDWRFMLQQIGQRKAILHVEPDLWGYAQHRDAQSPNNLPAVVRTANPTDCGNFENTFAGFAKCLIHMVRVYAPNARVGLHASAWATGMDVNINRNTSLNITDQAQRVGNYMNALGANEADFLAVEALDRDADYYRLFRGEDRWWNENQQLPNFAQHFQWVTELRRIIGKPLVWWQLPVGNPNLPNQYQRYRDNRANYFLNPSHVDEMVSMGGVLLAFGAGAGDQTNPLTDGGNLAGLMSAYKQSSAGLALCGTEPAEPEADPEPEPGTEPEPDPDPGTNPRPGSVVPAPSVPFTVQSIPGFNSADLSRLSDNRGRVWVRPLPLNTYVTLKLLRPLSHMLFQWMSSANYDYNVTQYGAPSSYQIQISSDSTNGSNGAWTTVANVQGNSVSARAHEIKGQNIQWVRFQVTAGNSAIDEIDIHDLSLCVPGVACDTWAFVGDSITTDTFWREYWDNLQVGRPFNEWVEMCQPERFPSMINFGIGGNNAGHVLARLQQTINDNPGIHFWAVGIGSNDSNLTQFEQNLVGILNVLKTNGKQPILARIPFSTTVPDSRIQSLNAVIDRLTQNYELPEGPDLYAFFKQNTSQLRDGLHPAPAGVESIQRLWAEVACSLGLLPETDPDPDPGTTDPDPDPGTTDPDPDPGTTDPDPDPGTTDPDPDPGTTDPDPDPGTTDPDPDPGTNPTPISLVPAPRVSFTVQNLPGFSNPELSNFFDNRGRVWIRPLPLNTDVTFKLSRPLSHMLFQWMSSANYDYNVTQYGAPNSYRIQISSNSTNGNNGTWTTALDIQGNSVAARAHEIEGQNIQWLRFRVTAGNASIDEFDIHDLSRCVPGVACDTWAFIGDSITADTFWREYWDNLRIGKPFNEWVAGCQSARFPSMINLGIAGDTSASLLARLQQNIQINPGVHFWAVGIGTNDTSETQFEQNLVAILDRLLLNGKQPILARIPFSTTLPDSRIQSLNAVIDRLTARYQLPAGPDLYTFFKQNPSQLRDGIHPTPAGVESIQRLWAEVACGFTLP